jgi:FG-GAP repeat
VIAGDPVYVVDSSAGVAYVLHGGPSTGAARLASGQSNSLFGVDVAGAGDLNGDGYADVAVSAPWFDAGQPDEGAAFVFAGSAAGIARGDPATAATQLESDQANARFGYPVAAAGDVNGDGYDDLLVGASRYAMAGPSAAAVFVFLGSATGIADGGPASAASALELDWMPFATTTWVHSLASEDVNGDRHRDVIAGSIHWDEDYSKRNVVAIFHGAESGIASGNSATAATVIEDEYYLSDWAKAAGAGDVNGDGYGDLIVGDRRYDGWGAAFVFHGTAAGIASGGLMGAANTLIDYESGWYGEFGASVAAAGDVNGDGYGDVIVGSAASGDGWLGLDQPASAAYVFHGSSSGIGDGGPETAATHLRADQFNAYMGEAVAAAGDVNGDGYGDVIVGAPGVNAHGGAAYAFLGGPAGVASGGPEVAALRIGPGDPDGRLGLSVAGAGDVNGDGAADLIVGSNGYELGADDGGRAFVVLPEPTLAASLASALALLAALNRLTRRRMPGNARCR